MVGAPPGASTVTPGAAAMPCWLADCCVMVEPTPSAPIWKVFCAQHAVEGQAVLQAVQAGHDCLLNQLGSRQLERVRDADTEEVVSRTKDRRCHMCIRLRA